MTETGGNTGAGRASSGSLRSATSSFKEDASTEPLGEKSSLGLTSIKLPSPWSPQAGLDELHFPHTPAPCSFACQLPGGLCIHHTRTKAERAFAFENPVVFYFLSAPLGKEMFCGRKVHCETVHAAQLSLLAILLLGCAGREWTRLSDGAWWGLEDGRQPAAAAALMLPWVPGAPASCYRGRVHDI